MRVLIIEDEEGIREVVGRYLAAEGHEVLEAADGLSGLSAFSESRPDFVILDLMLPGMDGYELCAAIRRIRPDVPLIMLTARDHESDKVAGLRVGADDYVTKPFSPRELMARVAAVARRSTSAGAPESLPDGLLVDTGAKRAFHFGQELNLTRSELLLAAALARRPMRTFSRFELLEQIRGDEADVTERAVDVHVANLRRKLDDAAAASGRKTINPVETVWGLGYRWRKEVTGIVRG